MQSLVESILKRFRGRLEPETIALIAQSPSPIAVACSGGPDSIAAALVVKALSPQPITLLHFNHKLRGRSSDHDAKFVHDFAQKMQMDVRIGEWKMPDKKNETAAREARLKFLHQWEHEIIVFGHHADDAVETLLMRLARGATLEGLCAPHAVNKMRNHLHLRPLINFRKKEILAALKELKIPYRKDASNDGTDYLRNRIRNKLLPLWQKIETRDVADGILKSRAHLKKFLSSDQKTSEAMEVEEDSIAEKFDIHLPFGATVFFSRGGFVSAKRVPVPSFEEVKKNSDPRARVWISDHKVLKLSPWRAGERYRPMGTGSRKIKEILNESWKEISPDLRAFWPVIRDENGFPVWLPGARITENAAIKHSDACAIELNFSPPRVSIASTNDVY